MDVHLMVILLHLAIAAVVAGGSREGESAAAANHEEGSKVRTKRQLLGVHIFEDGDPLVASGSKPKKKKLKHKEFLGYTYLEVPGYYPPKDYGHDPHIGGGGYGHSPHTEGGYGHEIHDPYKGGGGYGHEVHNPHKGYGHEIHDLHGGGGGYDHEIHNPHKGYGHEIHDPHGGGGYGHEIHDPHKGYGHEIHDPHSGGGYGHEIHKPHKGYGHEIHGLHKEVGYGDEVHDHGGGYGHEIHDPHGGYGHDDSHGGGYGHAIHYEGYKEPPKYVKPSPYYGPRYDPYDLIAPDKSKKNKKTKYGDDPIYESHSGGYHKDAPLAHFGGFGGGGSIGYNAGSFKGPKGYPHGGGGHKGHGGGGGGYKGPEVVIKKPKGYGGHHIGGGGGHHKGHGGGGGHHKGHGGGGGGGHHQGYGDGGGGDHHQGYGGGGGKHHGGFSTQIIKLEPGPPLHVDHYSRDSSYGQLKDPYNTYDAKANVRTASTGALTDAKADKVGDGVITTTNVDVSHMLLSDPYTASPIVAIKEKKVAEIPLTFGH